MADGTKVRAPDRERHVGGVAIVLAHEHELEDEGKAGAVRGLGCGRRELMEHVLIAKDGPPGAGDDEDTSGCG